jgi:hypothetical protein
MSHRKTYKREGKETRDRRYSIRKRKRDKEKDKNKRAAIGDPGKRHTME